MISYPALNPDPLTRSLFQSQIRLAPWCFGPEFQRDTPLPIGVFPIITVDSQKNSSLLVLTPQQPKKSIERCFPSVQIGEQFRLSIQTAHIWFETQLPIWLNNQSPLPPFLQCIYSDSQEAPQIVDGHSAGLALLLIQISILLELPLPKTLICSAALNTTGALLPVQGLEDKLRTIAYNCPIIQTVLVSSAQEEDARKIIASLESENRIQIYALETVQEALHSIRLSNGKTIIENLEAQLQKKDISLFIDFLFFRVLKGKSQIFGWKSLSRTLLLLRTTHAEELTHDNAQTLKLLSLISSRYAQTHTTKTMLTAEDVDWILQFPLPTILQVWPHLLQQLSLHPETIQNAAREKIILQTERYLPPKEEQIIAAPYLRILGAHARLNRSVGEKEEAFHKQLQAFHGWLNNSIYQEASYPLCELLELAGELNTPSFHEKAKNCYHLLHNRPDGIVPHNQGYILCAEMLRRYANRENWQAIGNILLADFSPFPHQLKIFVEKKIKSWISAPTS